MHGNELQKLTHVRKLQDPKIYKINFKIFKIFTAPIKNKINSFIISSYNEKSQNVTIQ